PAALFDSDGVEDSEDDERPDAEADGMDDAVDDDRKRVVDEMREGVVVDAEGCPLAIEEGRRTVILVVQLRLARCVRSDSIYALGAIMEGRGELKTAAASVTVPTWSLE
ncbi:hypothetical protein M407DRAFT_12773, partial [Tulasnella calospora MUT 4182]